VSHLDEKTTSLFLILGALVTIVVVIAGVILIASGDTVAVRFGLFGGAISPIILVLVSALRAEQAQKQTNGGMDARIAAAVTEALKARRETDRVVVQEAPRSTDGPLTGPSPEA
jgi:hypothetical protein